MLSFHLSPIWKDESRRSGFVELWSRTSPGGSSVATAQCSFGAVSVFLKQFSYLTEQLH